MELKGRLRLIADKIPVCKTLCDIGTDHGYIPIYLVQKGKCEKAIAADVKKGPLNSAKDNISRYGLSDRIETRLGNGLEQIGVGEADTIIIAGMGGNLITEILQKGYKQAVEAGQIILQPMNDMDITRKWLLDNGFDIYDEELVEEGTKIYNVICARWKNTIDYNVRRIYYYIGERLIERKDPLLGKLISRRLKQLERALNELKNANEPGKQVAEHYNYLISELRRLEERI